MAVAVPAAPSTRHPQTFIRPILSRTVHALSLNVSLLRGFPDPRQTPIKKTCGLEGGLPILVRVRHIGSVHQQFVARVRVIPSCSINQRVANSTAASPSAFMSSVYRPVKISMTILDYCAM